MMAIFTYDRPDGSTLVAIDGNAGLTDLYIRNVGQVELATNSTFTTANSFDLLDWTNGSGLNDNFYTVAGARPLYIASATPNQQEIPPTEANGFMDGDTSTLTDFVLSNGNIETTTPGAVTGEVRYDGNTWTFTNDAFGRLTFTGPAAGPRPVNGASVISPGITDPESRGAGIRGVVTIRWSAPVSTFVDTCPEIDVSYIYRNYVGELPADVVPPPPSSGGDFDVGVSAGPSSSFDLPPDNPKNGFGGVTVFRGPGISRVPGTTTLSGTITVHDVLRTGVAGSGLTNLTFGFSNATGEFVFTPQQNDWLEIAPGSTLGNLRFRNAFGVGTLDPGESFVAPGRVTIAGTERWFEYTREVRPSQVTVWPGLDVTNAITAEYTVDGGTFNVLSPIVAAPSLAVLGANTVRFEAPISVTGVITLSTSTVQDLVFPPAPNVVTAVFNAPSAAAAYAMRVFGSVTVSPSGSLSGALPNAAGELTQPAGLVRGVMEAADLLVYGTIYATTQLYDLRGGWPGSGTSFTTQPEAAGPDSGLIRGREVVVNMAQAGASGVPADALSDDISFHTVSLRTEVDTFRTRAGGIGPVLPGANLYPYDLSVRELDGITFDAVAGSSRPISLTAGGSIAMGSALSTASDVTIQALPGNATPSRFSVAGPLTTTRGKIRIVADGVTVGNSVAVTAADEDAERDDIWITANAGDVALNGLVSAVNRVKIEQANPLEPTVTNYNNRTPLTLPDPGIVVQTLDVPDDFVFDNVDVEVDITHAFVSDLVGTLIAPDGRRFRLFFRNGFDGDNFTGTIFDSEATTPINAGLAPFTGRFRPIDSLAPLYGGSALGTWRLEIIDGFNPDAGTLTNFGLRFRTVDPRFAGEFAVGKVAGQGRVVADSLRLDVEGQVGDASLRPADAKFFLRTNVDTLEGTVGKSASLDELNDINITSLQAGGFVSLRAGGVDPTSGVNAGAAALRANLIDIAGLDVAAPRGSLDVQFDTAKKIELGNAEGLRTGRSLNSLAAGDVRIRSAAGSIVALDAPVAGGNAVAVRVATTAALATPTNGQTLSLVTYSPGVPGAAASGLRGRGNLNAWLGVQVQPLRVGDRVLVKNQANSAENGVYTLSFTSTPTWGANTVWQLVRSSDADTAAKFASNTFVSVGEPQAGGVNQVGTWQVTANYIQLFGATKLNASYGPGSSTVTFGGGILNDGLRVGMVVFGPGIPENTTVTAVGATPPGTTITLSQEPTSAQANATLRFVTPAFAGTGDLSSGLDSVLITNLALAPQLEPGMLVMGDGIPSDTVITRILNATTVVISNGATVDSTGMPLSFIRPFATRTGTTTSAGATVTGLVTTGDLREGMIVVGPGIPANTTIASIVDGTTITLSNPATAGGVGVSLKFLAATNTNFGLAPISVVSKPVATDIGSDNPNSSVTFVVSTTAGTNSAAGSLGKMLTLRQQNTATLGGDPSQPAGSQPMGFQFSASIASDRTPIRLTQELPEITEAFTIGGSPLYPGVLPVGSKAAPPLIDGSRITQARSGRILLAGELASGLVVSGAAASGTVIRNVNLGGFSRTATSGGTTLQSAAIDVRDAAGVLVSTVKLGESELGVRLANGVGVRFAGSGTTSGTLLNSTIYGSNDSGLVVENGASGVSVVGTTFGKADNFNAVGARLRSGVNQFGVDPITPVQPIPQAAATRVSNTQFTLPASFQASAWRLVPGLQILGQGVVPTTGNTRATISTVSTNATTGVTTVTVTGGRVTTNGVVTFIASDQTAIPDVQATRVTATQFTLSSASKGVSALLYAGLRLTGSTIEASSAETPASISAISRNLVTGVTTVTITGGTITGNGLVRFGDIVATTLNGTSLVLPSSVNMANLFLGQAVSGTGIASGTVITAIDPATRTISFADGKRMTRTGFTGITFGVGGRNTVTQNRTGLILAAGATTVTNTSIVANTLNGIDISGSGVAGQHHTVGTAVAPSTRSNQIHSNGGWGVYFTPAADAVKNSVVIKGNYLGTTTLAVVASTLSNKKGNIGHFTTSEQVFAGLGSRLVPRAIDGIDPSNNQHGRYQGTAGGTGGGGGTGGTGGTGGVR